ncbi:prepilin-type N-terminal cleavage/methylation domain-containing protein [Desulforhopalus vacuolatus]|uniref:pilus assembly FimT family protein n=1 Tax=Desulforhopalus vacuolatus TaxID=40414 RepID=UPI00196240A6|nr:prepilin-type N-terminal cleavage/methylation domain-containing protein [Desulforhopalus vacuolatus]MBM9520647.1 prepilin-type N-terminal cleavage/methylation domain-containing protein [Desulforhopalus vacuolatus]
MTKNGLSFVEVMVVVALFLVLTVFAGPEMTRFSHTRKVNTLIRNTVTLLMDARLDAFKINSNTVVLFSNSEGKEDGDLNQITVFQDNGNGGGTAKDGVQQPNEKQTGFLSTDVLQGSSSTPARQSLLTFTTNFPDNRLIYRNRLGMFGGTIKVLWSGEEEGKVVINSLGRIRVEKSK